MMHLSEIPYQIEDYIYRFDCNLSDLVSYKSARHENGSLNNMEGYWGIDDIALCSIECNDGLFVLVCRRDKQKDKGNE